MNQPAPPTKKEVIIVLSVTFATVIMVVTMFGAQIQTKAANLLGLDRTSSTSLPTETTP